MNAAGNAYVTGIASSLDFPVTEGAVQPNIKYYYPKAFATEFSTDGSSLVYSALVGGSGRESANAIALDSKGNAYITGQTTSTDFPVTTNTFQSINYAYVARTQATGFIAKLNSTGTELVYATYLGAQEDMDNIWATWISTRQTLPPAWLWIRLAMHISQG